MAIHIRQTLVAVIADLPIITAALDNMNRTDTFFAPTNAAIASLLEWGNFADKAEAGNRLTSTFLGSPWAPMYVC